MTRPTKSVSQMSMKMSKAEKSAREEAEKQVVTNQTKPRADRLLNSPERKIFNKLKKHNEQFTEADSVSLNKLAQYLYMWDRLKEAHEQVDVFDEQGHTLERRMVALDKQISQHMTALCIPLNARLKLANDVAKVKIEERKLKQFESQNNQEVNPLLAVLEATKHVK